MTDILDNYGQLVLGRMKKLKIFATFKLQTDSREIIIDERRDRDTDRVIRLGKGKSRMD